MRLKRTLSVILMGILAFACCFFFASCDVEPSEFATWYLTRYTEKGKEYAVGYVYGEEVLSPNSITVSFKDGRVSLNEFGETREGGYEYYPSKFFGKVDSKLIVVFDDGERFVGNCYAAVFDGRTDYLHFENEAGDRYDFGSTNRDDYLYEREYAYSDFCTVNTAFENFFDGEYLLDDYTFECTFQQGERSLQITDKQVVGNFLEKTKTTALRDFSPDFNSATADTSYIEYTFSFKFEEAVSWYPIAQKTITFYYDPDVDFYFIIPHYEDYGQRTRYGVSAKKESAFSYLVRMSKA